MSEEKKENELLIVFKTAKVKSEKKGLFSMVLEWDEVITTPTKEVIVTPMASFPPKNPHNDLFLALKRLVPHWAIDAEEKDFKDFNKKYFESDTALTDESLSKFKVTGVYIKEVKNQKHVVLVGRKVLKTGKVINHSPMFNIENTEDGYVYAEQLASAVDKFLDEVELYTEGKFAVDPQITAFPETEAERTAVPSKNTKKKAS